MIAAEESHEDKNYPYHFTLGAILSSQPRQSAFSYSQNAYCQKAIQACYGKYYFWMQSHDDKPRQELEMNKHLFPKITKVLDKDRLSQQIQNLPPGLNHIVVMTNDEDLVQEIRKDINLMAKIKHIYCIGKQPKEMEELHRKYAIKYFENVQALVYYQKKHQPPVSQQPNFIMVTGGDKAKFHSTRCSLWSVLLPFDKDEAIHDWIEFVSRTSSFKDYTKEELLKQLSKQFTKTEEEAWIKFWIYEYTKEKSYFGKALNQGLRLLTHPLELGCLRLAFQELFKRIATLYRKQQNEAWRAKGFTCYRKCKMSGKQKNNLESNVNQIVELTGFLSTSKKKKIAQQFEGSTVFQITVPPNSNIQNQDLPIGLFANIQVYSDYSDEEEVLFAPLNYFIVKSVEHFKNKHQQNICHIKLEYIDYKQVKAQYDKGTSLEKSKVEFLQTHEHQNSLLTKLNTVADSLFYSGQFEQAFTHYHKQIYLAIKNRANISSTVTEELQNIAGDIAACLQKIFPELLLQGINMKSGVCGLLQCHFTPMRYFIERMRDVCIELIKRSKQKQNRQTRIQLAKKWGEIALSVSLLKSKGNKKDQAVCWMKLATIDKEEYSFQSALQKYKKALSIYQQLQGENSLSLLEPLQEMRKLLWAIGKSAEAQQCDKNALKIFKAQDPGSPQVQQCVSFLTKKWEIYQNDGQLQKAVETLQALKELYYRNLGYSNEGYALCILKIAQTKQKQGKLSDAVSLAKKSLQIFQELKCTQIIEYGQALFVFVKIAEYYAEKADRYLFESYNYAREAYNRYFESQYHLVQKKELLFIIIRRSIFYRVYKHALKYMERLEQLTVEKKDTEQYAHVLFLNALMILSESCQQEPKSVWPSVKQLFAQVKNTFEKVKCRGLSTTLKLITLIQGQLQSEDINKIDKQNLRDNLEAMCVHPQKHIKQYQNFTSLKKGAKLTGDLKIAATASPITIQWAQFITRQNFLSLICYNLKYKYYDKYRHFYQKNNKRLKQLCYEKQREIDTFRQKKIGNIEDMITCFFRLQEIRRTANTRVEDEQLILEGWDTKWKQYTKKYEQHKQLMYQLVGSYYFTYGKLQESLEHCARAEKQACKAANKKFGMSPKLYGILKQYDQQKLLFVIIGTNMMEKSLNKFYVEHYRAIRTFLEYFFDEMKQQGFGYSLEAASSFAYLALTYIASDCDDKIKKYTHHCLQKLRIVQESISSEHQVIIAVQTHILLAVVQFQYMEDDKKATEHLERAKFIIAHSQNVKQRIFEQRIYLFQFQILIARKYQADNKETVKKYVKQLEQILEAQKSSDQKIVARCRMLIGQTYMELGPEQLDGCLQNLQKALMSMSQIDSLWEKSLDELYICQCIARTCRKYAMTNQNNSDKSKVDNHKKIVSYVQTLQKCLENKQIAVQALKRIKLLLGTIYAVKDGQIKQELIQPFPELPIGHELSRSVIEDFLKGAMDP